VTPDNAGLPLADKRKAPFGAFWAWNATFLLAETSVGASLLAMTV
jgi:hypothetical protein